MKEDSGHNAGNEYTTALIEIYKLEAKTKKEYEEAKKNHHDILAKALNYELNGIMAAGKVVANLMTGEE